MTSVSMTPEQIKNVDDILGKILVRALEKMDYATARDAEVASRLLRPKQAAK